MSRSQPAPAHPPRSPEEQARIEAAIIDLFQHRIAFNETLGIRIDAIDPQAPRAHLDMRPELVGHYLYGQLHGGVIAAALDGMGAFALMVAIADRQRHETVETLMQRFVKFGTIDLRIDYLNRGIGKRFEVLPQVLRVGGRTGTVRADLRNDSGVLIATAVGVYKVG